MYLYREHSTQSIYEDFLLFSHSLKSTLCSICYEKQIQLFVWDFFVGAGCVVPSWEFSE